jgi:hypothetical protein
LRAFLFSGFPALVYQLTWQRTLFRIFGVNIESVTIVVTAFMLGTASAASLAVLSYRILCLGLERRGTS